MSLEDFCFKDNLFLTPTGMYKPEWTTWEWEEGKVTLKRKDKDDIEITKTFECPKPDARLAKELHKFCQISQIASLTNATIELIPQLQKMLEGGNNDNFAKETANMLLTELQNAAQQSKNL